MQKTILFLAANPKNTSQLDLKQEAEEINQELQRLQRGKQLVLKQHWATTADEVRHTLLDIKPQFVHFSGHGAGQAGIVLEDETGNSQLISTDALANFLAPFAQQIECVILNACFSAMQASAIVKHIHYVIGMNLPIQDKAAISFAIGFYDALAAGDSIATAFQMGRTTVQAKLPELAEHLKPVLKTRYADTYWQLPIPQNPFFSGREDVLQKVQETLHFRQVAALSGIGGVGKTQTAAHYAHQHRHEYQAVLWTLADTVASLHLGLAAMARTLDLPEQQAQEQQQTIVAVKRWLETHNDWLLILDNADDVKIASELTPLLNGYAGIRHLLFTTRAQITEPFAQRVEIKELSIEEGITFLLRRATDIPQYELKYAFADKKRAKKIVEALGGLPLALDQAGAYIRETQCGLAGYLERYRTHAPKLLAKRGTLAMAHDHPESVAKTWLLSFENIANENSAAAELLRLCAFLHSDNIPEEIFTKGSKHLGDMLAPVAADVVELDDARRVILKYSLVSYAPKTKIWSIHRLVQLILKHGMDETAQRTWAERSVRAVESAFPSGDIEFSEWEQCKRLLPCAQTCAELIEEWKLEFEEAALLLNQIGYYQTEKAEYAQAKPLYERALAIYEKVYGKEHPNVAGSLNNLAELYRAQGAYEQAKPLYERALAIREKILGIDHPDVAHSLWSLAVWYHNQSEYQQAKPLYERALKILNQVFKSDHPDVRNCSENYADLLEKMEQQKTTTSPNLWARVRKWLGF